MKEPPVKKSLLWLAPIALGWGGLIILAHQTSEWTIVWTHRLFGWMILLIYVFLWGWAITFSRHRKNTILKAITTTLVCGVLLLCVELIAVLGVVHWNLVFQKLTGKEQKYTWAYRHDRELAFRRRPNDHWTEWPISDIEGGWNMPPSLNAPLEFTYDSRGYRNLKDIDVADVLLIGDSYVEGWYVSDEETIAQHLQVRLGGPVMNLGIAGYGTLQEFRVLKIDGIRFKPKIVIWFFFEGNDIYDDYSFEQFMSAELPTEGEMFPSPHGLAYDQGVKARLFTLAVLHRLRGWSANLPPSYSPYFGHIDMPGKGETMIYFADYAAVPWTEWEAKGWNRAKGILEEVANFSKTRGFQILFSFVPIKFRVYQSFLTPNADSPCNQWKLWPLAELFSEFCKTHEFPCLDLTPLFKDSVRNGGMPYSPVDTHWSPEGHRLVAEILEKELEKREWLTNPPRTH